MGEVTPIDMPAAYLRALHLFRQAVHRANADWTLASHLARTARAWRRRPIVGWNPWLEAVTNG
ncbi:MAG: hypothetical protein ACOY5Y_07170 [Pseudomonadota bacterium]